MKTCTKCKQEFPATLEYFSKNGKFLRSECKKCKYLKDKKWVKQNPEKVKINAKRWRDSNPKYTILWRNNNIDKSNKIIQKWQKANPEKLAAVARRRRATIKGNGYEPYTNAQVLEAYGINCYLCDMPIDLNAPRGVGQPGWRSGLHIEHFIDIACGGPDTLENVRPSHAWCNLTKVPKINN